MRKFNWRLIRRSIKFFFQRVVRGWDDSETWDLGNTTLAKWILPRLKAFRKYPVGTPMNYIKDMMNPKDSEHEKWLSDIDDMIHYFEIVANDEILDLDERALNGRECFREFREDLWW